MAGAAAVDVRPIDDKSKVVRCGKCKRFIMELLTLQPGHASRHKCHHCGQEICVYVVEK